MLVAPHSLAGACSRLVAAGHPALPFEPKLSPDDMTVYEMDQRPSCLVARDGQDRSCTGSSATTNALLICVRTKRAAHRLVRTSRRERSASRDPLDPAGENRERDALPTSTRADCRPLRYRLAEDRKDQEKEKKKTRLDIDSAPTSSCTTTYPEDHKAYPAPFGPYAPLRQRSRGSRSRSGTENRCAVLAEAPRLAQPIIE